MRATVGGTAPSYRSRMEERAMRATIGGTAPSYRIQM